MTAQELIVQLQSLAPDTKIVVRGYEDGYNDILRLKAVKLKAKINSEWYEGEYVENHDPDSIIAFELFGENQNPQDDLK